MAHEKVGGAELRIATISRGVYVDGEHVGSVMESRFSAEDVEFCPSVRDASAFTGWTALPETLTLEEAVAAVVARVTAARRR